MTRILPFALLLLAACGGTDARFLVDPSPAAAESRIGIGVGTLEVRDVSLPAYAEESEILVEDSTGALAPIKNAVWADDPVRAMTMALADTMDRQSSATVAAEPWPLETEAQAAVHVRVSEMAARADGMFHLTGQFAISSYDRVVRERIERFDITVPLADTTPGAVARATSAATGQLAGQIMKSLSR
ncbi:membrane integrity-associated transporter subunit PqiC [Maritimibacter sp. DP1N21-5]|uniref:PqiC family protein n=1 Tax=Maritimibacter sp. DP1N21-5 TaxID=2836867 RepID=UPI001C46E13A|nr:PqiC family protein [Maritimibacter sp. DP1N21-5]MBV7410402.1 PqiC family protein [Maritimibacter sp. DP1N21-5]